MATAAQLDIVQAHVEDALTRGARDHHRRIPAGARPYFEPTVLADADHSMVCMREETFGPTIPVMRVADEEEAVRLRTTHRTACPRACGAAIPSLREASRAGSRPVRSTSTTSW